MSHDLVPVSCDTKAVKPCLSWCVKHTFNQVTITLNMVYITNASKAQYEPSQEYSYPSSVGLSSLSTQGRVISSDSYPVHGSSNYYSMAGGSLHTSKISYLLLYPSFWLLVPGLSSQFFCHCFLYNLFLMHHQNWPSKLTSFNNPQGTGQGAVHVHICDYWPMSVN